MKTYFHFKIKNSQNKSPVLLTQSGMGAYRSLIDKVNYELNLNQTTLRCARFSADITPLAVIHAGQIIARPSDIPKDLLYIEFPNTEDLMLISSYQTGIKLQQQIDRLQFLSPRSKIQKIASAIEYAHELQDIPGRVVDALMYQLWQRDEELIRNMGYEYHDDEVDKKLAQMENDDGSGEIPLF